MLEADGWLLEIGVPPIARDRLLYRGAEASLIGNNTVSEWGAPPMPSREDRLIRGYIGMVAEIKTDFSVWAIGVVGGVLNTR